MACGWTWEYIDEFVTVPRLLEMAEYWKKYPPVHIALAAFTGAGAGSGSGGAGSAPASGPRSWDEVRPADAKTLGGFFEEFLANGGEAGDLKP